MIIKKTYFAFIALIFLILLVGCNGDPSDTGNVGSPVYLGMTVSSHHNTPLVSYSMLPRTSGKPVSNRIISGDLTGNEKCLEPYQSYEGGNFKRMSGVDYVRAIYDDENDNESNDYYTTVGAYILITVNLYNPNSFTILSFVLNGRRFQPFEFQPGSNSERLIMSINVGESAGVSSFTLDEILYVEGSIVNNVELNEQRTVNVAVFGASVSINLVEELTSVMSTTSILLMPWVNDYSGLLEMGGASVKISLLELDRIDYTIVKHVESEYLVGGINEILFENLNPSTLYQVIFHGFFDDFSQGGMRFRYIHTDIHLIMTPATVLFDIDSISVTYSSVEFNFVWHTSVTNRDIVSRLYKGDVFIRNIYGNQVDELQSNTEYTVVSTYVNSHGESSSIVFNFATVEEVSPEIVFNEIVSTQSFAVLDFEINNLSAVTINNVMVKLLLDGELINYLSDLTEWKFTNLDANKIYEIVVMVSYEFNYAHLGGELEIRKHFDTTNLLFEYVGTLDPNEMELRVIGLREAQNTSSVVIPQSWNGLRVSAISPNAFYNLSCLTTVILPEGINMIGGRAFQGTNLEKIVIPSTVVSSWDELTNPFKGIESLKVIIAEGSTTSHGWQGTSITSIYLPQSVTNIPEYSFYGVSTLIDVSFPEGLLSIGDYAFYGTSLAEAILPNGLITIGNSAFVGTYLSEIIIPSTVISSWNVLTHPFREIANLSVVLADGSTTTHRWQGTLITSIYLPRTVSTIPMWAFTYVSTLTEVNLPEGILSIGTGAFSYTNLTQVTLPSTLIATPSGSGSWPDIDWWGHRNWHPFRGIDNLSIILADGTTNSHNWYGSSIASIYLPESVTQICYRSFYGVSSLTNVTLSEGLLSIGDYAFYGTSLNEVTLPNGLITIGNSAFAGTNLTEINIPSTVVSSWGWDSNPFREITNLSVVLADGSTTSHVWSDTFIVSIYLPQSVTVIPNAAFARVTTLTEIELHDGLSTIGPAAFSRTSLSEIVIPSSVATIGNNAFANIENLSVILADGFTTSHVWSGTSIVSIYLPQSVTVIPNGAFEGVTTLTEIVLPADLLSIGWHAFRGTSLTEIVIPASVAILGSGTIHPFRGIENLNVILADGSTTSHVWSGTSIISIYLPQTVIDIPRNAFEGTLISEIVIPSSVASIGSHAFEGARISEIIIPASVAAIGHRAFANIENLNVILAYGSTTSHVWRETSIVSIYLPQSVIDIANGAFYQVSTLVKVTLNEGLQTIGSRSFLGTGLMKVEIPASVTYLSATAFDSTVHIVNL